MSKKLAAGADCILLDVKTGNGAFMKTLDGSIELAKTMTAIGLHNNRKVAALITDMDTPLGYAIGNSLEVAESMEVLKGRGPSDLKKVCRELAANLLFLAGKGTLSVCFELVEDAIQSGKAFSVCKQMFAAQGGDTSVLDNPSQFPKAKYSLEVCSPESGYVSSTNTEKIGISSVLLGAGRQTIEDSIDFAAGIILHKKTGDWVEKGQPLATFYTEDENRFAAAKEMFLSAYSFANNPPKEIPLVLARVTEEGVECF